MRDKNRVEDNKMFVASINDPAFIGASAKRMSTDLLEKEFNGPGDTLEAAAFRLQTKYGVDAEITLQGWRREIREMKASRWLSLFVAYTRAGFANAEQLYAAERELHEDNSALVRLADFVAGPKKEE